MSIRLRTIDAGTDMERSVALCANETDPRDDDIYIHDGFHQALADKFWADWSSSGIIRRPNILGRSPRKSLKSLMVGLLSGRSLVGW